jgi:cardiolipin synthase
VISYVPNVLTVFRLLTLPVFVWLYGREAPGIAWGAAVVAFVAAWSDVFDGFIARRYHVESDFGRVVDPFVDRAFYATILITLWWYHTLPLWAVLPVVLRDVVMVAGGAVLLRVFRQKPRVMQQGRTATLVLALGIGFFVLDVRTLAWALYGAGALLYLGAGALYILRTVREWRRGELRAGQPG